MVKGFSFKDFIRVYTNCWLIAGISAIFPYFLTFIIDKNTFVGFIFIGSMSVLSAIIVIYILGIDKMMRKKVNKFIVEKVRIYRK